MNIEQRIKKIEKRANKKLPTHVPLEQFKIANGGKIVAKQAMEIINHLQSELKELKASFPMLKTDRDTLGVKILKEELERYKSLDEWKDISSAPKDGSLVIITYGDTIEVAKNYGSGWLASDGADFEYGNWDNEVTHWKSLSKPPEQNH